MSKVWGVREHAFKHTQKLSHVVNRIDLVSGRVFGIGQISICAEIVSATESRIVLDNKTVTWLKFLYQLPTE